MNRIFVRALVLSSLSTFAWAEAPADSLSNSQLNDLIQGIETSFRSVCARPADPSSQFYYVDAVQSGRQTAAETHRSIQLTCNPRPVEDECARINGLQELCRHETR